MQQIHVTMQDDFTGAEINRVIDLSLFAISECLYNVDRQNAALHSWIAERAEPQHETSLSLIAWSVY